jgi:hypothetical protein
MLTGAPAVVVAASTRAVGRTVTLTVALDARAERSVIVYPKTSSPLNPPLGV